MTGDIFYIVAAGALGLRRHRRGRRALSLGLTGNACGEAIRRRALRRCRVLKSGIQRYNAARLDHDTGGAVLVVEPLGRRWGLWPGAQLKGSPLTAGCPKAAVPGRFRDHLAHAVKRCRP